MFVGEESRAAIRDVLAGLDPSRMERMRRMTVAERAEAAMAEIAREEAVRQSELLARYPQLSGHEALVVARSGPEGLIATYVAPELSRTSGDRRDNVERTLALFGGSTDWITLTEWVRQMGGLDLWRQWQRVGIIPPSVAAPRSPGP